MKKYDVFIVGAGTSGGSAAYILADEGLKVGIADPGNIGGTCALRGCEPKKFFFEAAKAIAKTKDLEGKGVRGSQGDWFQVMMQKREFTKPIPAQVEKTMAGKGIDLYREKAEFADENTIRAGGGLITADYFIAAVGSGPMRLGFPGEEHMATNVEFLDLDEMPEEIIFVGGGFISAEFAHYAARFGAKASILEHGPRPLKIFDADIAKEWQIASEDAGIKIFTGIDIVSIEKIGGKYTVKTGGGAAFIADLVVHGAGRPPALDGLALENAGVDYGKSGIAVDPRMQSKSNPRVFAIGDCAATIPLSFVAELEAKTASLEILSRLKGSPRPGPMEYGAVPTTLFTYPSVSMVGKTEDDLKKEGIEYDGHMETEMNWVGFRRAGIKRAAYKLLVRKDSRQILGFHFLSHEPEGVVEMARRAVEDGKSVDELWADSQLASFPTPESDLKNMLAPLLSKSLADRLS